MSDSYELKGKIKVINETQTFGSGFQKREFVVSTLDEKYPQDIKFEVVKDKCDFLDLYDHGEQIKVTFNVRGNESNGKHYVNLSAWKIEKANGQAPQPASQAQPRQVEPVQDSADDIPF